MIDFLPQHLANRTRIVCEVNSAPRRTCIVYWMQTAVRAEENPALDVAIQLAVHWKLPLLVYHAISERYEYASDRHHTFVLEAARDVQKKFQRQGISYAFHLEHHGRAQDYLGMLADKASSVIVEDMPTNPSRKFLKALKQRSSCCILAVDTACVLPMQLVGKAYTRAFEYREATNHQYADLISRPWPHLESKPEQFDLRQLPFECLDLGHASIPKLVGRCDIDHSIGPVLDTQGGSEAGYNRWNQFRDSKLKAYAKDRNSPIKDGSSRMSAYLHYGMVSPLRIAREAAAQKGEGSEKFLDELLIWRELAYAFCFYRPDHQRWSAIPEWAQQTLLAHAEDRRGGVYSWEQLARGQTDDELWNAAQKSLVVHGELHNNLRMTWGKAILNWRRCPKQALRLITDLNHRFALDGRDPASFGGILWCLGQFDRPFYPEQPIMGTVRPRPTLEHSQRIDVKAYRTRVCASRSAKPPRIAIIGAGISGAIAARILADHGLPLTLFEKSRGVGGRMATRRYPDGDFDHGAQYFTARDKQFRRYLRSWIEVDVASPWTGRIVAYDEPRIEKQTPPQTRYVASPGMTGLVKHVVQGLDVRFDTQVQEVVKHEAVYELKDSQQESLGYFDRVIAAIPAPQSLSLLAEFPEMAIPLASVEMDPCWCLMLQVADTLKTSWSGAFVNTGKIRWIARNTTKPGRNGQGESIVIHASSDWTNKHLDKDTLFIQSELLGEFWKITGLDEQTPLAMHTHRWKYAIPSKSYPDRYVAQQDNTLLACGDWAGGPKVEGAFLSGCAAAGRILRTLEKPLSEIKQPLLF
jgi:photolyase PhrII